MDFLILRPLSPKTGYHFFEGGGLGGSKGSKVFAQQAPSSGEAIRYHIKLWSNGKATCCKVLGRRFESRLVDCRRHRPAIFARPGFEPPTQKSVVSRITIQSKLALRYRFSPLLGAESATDKKPKLCVSV